MKANVYVLVSLEAIYSMDHTTVPSRRVVEVFTSNEAALRYVKALGWSGDSWQIQEHTLRNNVFAAEHEIDALRRQIDVTRGAISNQRQLIASKTNEIAQLEEQIARLEREHLP